MNENTNNTSEIPGYVRIVREIMEEIKKKEKPDKLIADFYWPPVDWKKKKRITIRMEAAIFHKLDSMPGSVSANIRKILVNYFSRGNKNKPSTAI